MPWPKRWRRVPSTQWKRPCGPAADGLARRFGLRSAGLPSRLRRSAGRVPPVGRRRGAGRSSAIGHLLVVKRPRGSRGSSICEGLRILGLPTPEQSRAGASLPAPAPFTSRPPPGRLFCDQYDLFAPLASPVSVAPMWLPSPKLPSPQHHLALQCFREGAACLVGSCTKYPLCYGAVQDGIKEYKECKSAFPKNALILWQS